MADGELLDAREAMSLLGINENDLQTLVARGDLRAFRSAGTMKFRRDDVQSLKTEKGTEPTIIIPAASGVRKSASGILPALPPSGSGVQSSPIPAPAPVMPGRRPGSRVGAGTSRVPAASATAVSPAVTPAAMPLPEPVVTMPSPTSATSDIVLDDIELMPADDASVTNQVTAAQPAIADPGGATVMETAAQMPAVSPELAASETAASVSAPTVTASGRRTAVQASTPAMSRVRPAVAPGVTLAGSKRTQAIYVAKSASPAWTVIAGLNTVVFVFAALIIATMMTRGTYDRASGERVIPPFLSANSTFPVYKWCYESTPGNPKDKKPSSEYDVK